MPTNKKNFDQTAYFNFLQACVQKSDSALDNDQVKELLNRFFDENELRYFNITELKRELFHDKNALKSSTKGSDVTTFYSLKFEALYKYVEMVELKESRIAAKQATKLSIIAIIISVFSLIVAVVKS